MLTDVMISSHAADISRCRCFTAVELVTGDEVFVAKGLRDRSMW